LSIRKTYINIFIIVISTFSVDVAAQVGPFSNVVQASDNSPYSFFGLGELSNPYYSYLQHMGGLGAAFKDAGHINSVNPASYATLLSASFETGLYGEYSTLTEGQNSFSSWNGSLNYFALAFPLVNPINDLLDRKERKYDLGMAFSLQPYTTVGYDITSTEQVDNIKGVTRNYVGNGGTYAFKWGNSIKIKDFSAGVNLGYLFGSIGTDRTVRLDSLGFSFHNAEFANSHISGFLWNAGVQYDYTLNQAELDESKGARRKYITFGAYGNTKSNFNTTNDVLFLTVRDEFDVQAFATDTIINVIDSLGSGKTPATIGIGAMYYDGNRMGIGFNFEYQGWSAYENEINPMSLTNAYTISVGGFIRPDPQSFTNYLKRIHYQLGAFYSKQPTSSSIGEVTSFGISTGLELPFNYQRRASSANIGVTFGTSGRGTTISENFIRFNFGFTFNSSEWFIKRKYN